MHEQILILLLHLKCLCYIINLILHLLLSRFITFFPESSLLFPEHFLFLHSIMFLLPWFQFVLLVILCSQPSKSIQDFATCTVMDGTAALVFLNVPSEFMFVDGSRSWILTLGFTLTFSLYQRYQLEWCFVFVKCYSKVASSVLTLRLEALFDLQKR